MNGPMFQISFESRKLGDFLIAHSKKKDFVTVLEYDTLSKVAGCDVTKKRYVLRTARAIVQREERMLFQPVKGIGIKLLTPSEEVGVGEDGLKAINKKATKTLKEMSCVKFDELSDQDKIRHNVNASIVGATRQFTGRNAKLKIEGAVVQQSERIDVSDAIRLFSSGKSASK